jgi:hypothetical protein
LDRRTFLSRVHWVEPTRFRLRTVEKVKGWGGLCENAVRKPRRRRPIAPRSNVEHFKLRTLGST